MIVVVSYRQEIETITGEFFPYFNLAKDTRMNNVSHCDRISEQYMAAIVYNSVLTETELIFRKQLLNTATKKIRIKLNNGQAAVLYRELFVIPIDSDHVWQNILRNKWISHLEQGLITIGMYQVEGALHY